MKYTYQIVTAKNTESLKRTAQNGEVTWIPINEANSDYQAYLRHLAGEDEAQSL